MRKLGIDYSFNINLAKLKTNYDFEIPLFGIKKNLFAGRVCDWIGLNIDMKTLSIEPNVSHNNCTSTVNFVSKNSIKWLSGKLLFFLLGCYNIGGFFSLATNNHEKAV